MNIQLAAISGDAVINSVIWLIVYGVILWLLWWLLNYVNPPEPFKKVGNVILAIIAVVLIINVLLGLAGRPFIKW